MDDITIVTAFFDIGRGFWKNKHRRTTRFYIQSFLNYLDYPYKMVCYVDDRCIDYVLEHYTRSSHNNKVFIPINAKWLEKNIHAWKQIPKDREIMQSSRYREFIDHRQNIMYPDGIPKNTPEKRVFPENEVPEYNAINHAKIDFINNAIDCGYVNESIVCWSDFGYFGTQHNNVKTTFPTEILDKTRFSPNRITFFLQKEITEQDTDPLYMLICAPELFTGTFWGGPTYLMPILQNLYHDCVEDLYSVNISDDDQHIYLRCCLKDSDIFDLKLNTTGEWPKGLVFFEKKN
jgi:hypothetical protein